MGKGAVEVGELGNQIREKKCIKLIELDGGGEFARQMTDEEPKEE